MPLLPPTECHSSLNKSPEVVNTRFPRSEILQRVPGRFVQVPPGNSDKDLKVSTRVGTGIPSSVFRSLQTVHKRDFMKEWRVVVFDLRLRSLMLNRSFWLIFGISSYQLRTLAPTRLKIRSNGGMIVLEM